MNLQVLTHIVNNAPEKIEELARTKKANSEASLGVAKALIGNGGNVSSLSEAQKYHYENCIQPLLENVPCDGIFGHNEDDGTSTCAGNDKIDDASLLGCYLEDNFICQICRYESEKMGDD